MTQLLTSSADFMLADLVEELSQKLAAGNSADVEDFLADHADHAEKLRPLIPTLQMLVEIGSSPVAAGRSRTNLSEANGHETNGHPVLGDFRILREVGRGGMGVVYEAEQISLRRRVALKVLPSAAMLDPRALQRFRNEAQAAAALHHSQIVPIYGVGCERGVHYYAMQFIDGLTLAEVITALRESAGLAPLYQPEPPVTDAAAKAEVGKRKTMDLQPTVDHPSSSPAPNPQAPAPPSATETEVLAALSTEKSRTSPAWFRRIAEQFAQVAEALHHAHEQGVTHRDIKPANLMLDRLGHIWITDFGLARIEGEGNLTMTGDLVGTLRYMSPEQSLAKRIGIDHRTDIYSLGITLYELLTLHPALPGHGRQELLRQIAFEEPKAPRKHNPGIPRDLETIVLKMIEKNPAERYQTATELAADFKRFVEDRHIAARRPSLYSRAVKWSRRHVEWVVSASLVAVILLAATTLVTFIAAAHERERSTERLRLNQEIGDELRQATALAQNANSAKNNDRLLWGQASEHAQRAAALAKNEIADTKLRDEVSNVLKDLELRKRDWALLAAIDNAWLVQLDTRQIGDGPQRERVAPIFEDALATFGIKMGREPPEEAKRKIVSRPRDVQLAIITILDELLYYPDDIRNRWIEEVLALADQDPWRAAKRLANKLPTAAERLKAIQKLAIRKGVDDQPTMLIAHLGMELHDHGDNPGGIAVMRNAAHRNPDDPQINHYLAFAYSQSSPPQLFEAARYATAAVSLQPQNPHVIAELGGYLINARMPEEAVIYLQAGLRIKPDSATLHWRLADALMMQGMRTEAAKEYRSTIRLQPTLADAHSNLGVILSDSGQLDEAIKEFQEAIHLKPRIRYAHSNLGTVLRQKGRLNEAVAACRQELLIFPHAKAYSDLGRALDEQGNLDEAVAAYRDAIRVVPTYTSAHLSLVKLLCKQGKFDDATAAIREAVRRETPLSTTRLLFGQLLTDQGMLDEAFAMYQDATRHYEKAFADDPSLVDDVRAAHRYNAACAAMLTATAKGQEAQKRDNAERSRLKHQALAWLGEELVAWKKVAARLTPKQVPQVVETLQHWQQDPDLASLRDKKQVQQFPAEDQELCRKLWADHAELLKSLQARLPAEKK